MRMHWSTLVAAALIAAWGIVMLRPPARFLEANFTLYRRLWGWLIDVDEAQYYSWSALGGLFSLAIAGALLIWFIVDAINH